MTDQDKEILETELFNRVLLNRIENKRDEIKRLKSTNYQLKTQLKKQSGSQLIKEIFAFVGMISIAIFTLLALYKAFL